MIAVALSVALAPVPIPLPVPTLKAPAGAAVKQIQRYGLAIHLASDNRSGLIF